MRDADRLHRKGRKQGQDSCGFFFFNDTATTEIYTLSLHDALPICKKAVSALIISTLFVPPVILVVPNYEIVGRLYWLDTLDRKSTRLNSSHANISYAVFCLKNKTIANLHSPRSPTAGSLLSPPSGS